MYSQKERERELPAEKGIIQDIMDSYIDSSHADGDRESGEKKKKRWN